MSEHIFVSEHVKVELLDARHLTHPQFLLNLVYLRLSADQNDKALRESLLVPANYADVLLYPRTLVEVYVEELPVQLTVIDNENDEDSELVLTFWRQVVSHTLFRLRMRFRYCNHKITFNHIPTSISIQICTLLAPGDRHFCITSYVVVHEPFVKRLCCSQCGRQLRASINPRISSNHTNTQRI